jgi:asparagine synthetase B (glutamine-hydrolysing)
MCTFKITNYPKFLPIDKFLKLGGPDFSNTIKVDNVIFNHNLLAITGDLTPQPIIKNNILYMLLGEVYNYDSTKYNSDLYDVIDKYELYQDDFINYLDGEFLIIIYDMKSNIINFYTDPWSTRMCWYDLIDNSYFYFGTFPISTKSKRFLHNSHYTYNIVTDSIILKNKEIHKWDFNNFKDSFADWDQAFLSSVKKRYHKKDNVLALSSGYDSVCIALAFSDLNLNFQSLNLNMTENVEDLDTFYQTLEYTKRNNDITILNRENILSILDENSLQAEFLDFCFFNYKYITTKLSYKYSLSIVCNYINTLNKKILFTGTGPDGIIDNYFMKKTKNSFFNVDNDTFKNFPYEHFYGGRQRAFIDRQEYVSLTHSIETRNPFLDKTLTQEWFYLKNSLKNKEYKSPLANFLKTRGIKIPEKIAGMNSQVF